MPNIVTTPARDRRGRLLEATPWPPPPRPAGFGWEDPELRRCARDGCRQPAMRRSEYCRWHDLPRRQKRAAELREGRGKPPTPTEAAQLFRADLKNLWSRSPWYPAETIWLTPRLEAEFVEAVRRGGLTPDATAPSVLNTLRWGWRRSMLNHDDTAGWDRAVSNAKRKLEKIGPAPEGYIYQAPSAQPPGDPRIKLLERAAGAFEPARVHPVLDRSTRCRHRRQDRAVPEPPADFDVGAFVFEHRDVLHPLLQAHALDPDGQEARGLALAYRLALDEQAREQGRVGPAYNRWQVMLRALGHGGPLVASPVPTGRIPPSTPQPSRRDPQHMAEDDAFLALVMAEVEARDDR